MSLIADATSRQLELALDLRQQRAELLTANIANADTPQYQPVDLAFEGELSRALDADADTMPPGWRATDVGHLAGRMEAEAPPERVILRPDITNTLDGNGVDLDKELARFTDNNVKFQTTVESARRRYQMLVQVITELGQA